MNGKDAAGQTGQDGGADQASQQEAVGSAARRVAGEKAALEAHVRSLGRTERLVVILHYAEELTTAEIGLVLDVPEARVLAILDQVQAQARTMVKRQTKPRVKVVSDPSCVPDSARLG